MKIVRFKYQNKKYIGKLSQEKVYILKNKLVNKDDSLEMIKKYPNPSLLSFEKDGINVEKVKLLSPMSRTENDILCIGLNYKSHIEESKDFFEKNDFATYFSKRAQVISGPNSFIDLDPNVDDCMDYETELAVIIGKKGKNIPVKDALDYVFAYTIINDYTARRVQKIQKQFFKGKSLDGYTALGPSLVSKDEIKNPHKLFIKTRVNGETRQDSSTKYMVRNIETIISELSQGLSLVPGDIIATGTPKGVGIGFNPPRFLQKGDIVESEIENIGVLKNIIK